MTILSDKSEDYTSSQSSDTYPSPQPVVARFIEHRPDESGLYNKALGIGL